MTIRQKILSFIMYLIIFHPIFSQERGLSLGLRLPNITSPYQDHSSSLTEPTFYYTHKIGSMRLEPGLGMLHIDDNGWVYTYTIFGLGALKEKNIIDNTLNRYFGVRLGFTYLLRDDRDDWDEKDTELEIFTTISPTIGLEYLFGKNFSISGEILFNYLSYNKSEYHQFDTSSKIFLRFYF